VRLPEGVAESIEVAAYYAVAETLTNTTKHAEASRIDVTVEPREGRLWVRVRDDGVGGADPACGSGLVGLKDRIEAFGGTMTLDSPSGGGTTLVAQLPLPEHPALEAEPWYRLSFAAKKASGCVSKRWRRRRSLATGR
jgi:signal transduction histidine kinase